MTEKVVILALYLVGTNCMAYMFLDIILKSATIIQYTIKGRFMNR